jgi:Catechol dioxygenase N terminus
LTRAGTESTTHKNEFVLLSDCMGLSALVDEIEHPKPVVHSLPSCFATARGGIDAVCGRVVLIHVKPARFLQTMRPSCPLAVASLAQTQLVNACFSMRL